MQQFSDHEDIAADTLPSDAVQLIERHLNSPLSGLHLQRLKGGRQNRVFRISDDGCRSYVLKLFELQTLEEPLTDVMCAYLYSEFKQQPIDYEQVERYLSAGRGGSVEFEIGAPIIGHGRSSGNGAAWCLMQDLGGGVLFKQCVSVETIKALAQTLASLHSVTSRHFALHLHRPSEAIGIDRWFKVLVDALCNQHVAAYVSSEAIEKVRRVTIELPHRFVLTHGDLHGSNIIVDRGKAKLIDWDETTIGGPERDLTFVVYAIRGLVGDVDTAHGLSATFLSEYQACAAYRVSEAAMNAYAILHLLSRINLFAGSSTPHLQTLASEFEQRVSALG